MVSCQSLRELTLFTTVSIAVLKYQATPEGLRYPSSRGLRAEQMRELLNGHYITHRKKLLITGPTGCGKSWIANVLGEQACREKHSVRYCRTWRLLEQLTQGRVDGSWLKYLKQLQKIQVLILDDLGLEQLSNAQCNDLLELIEDRYGQSSTSQFPVDKWHGLMENPTTADAILERLVHNSHRVVLQGESLRKNPPTVESTEVLYVYAHFFLPLNGKNHLNQEFSKLRILYVCRKKHHLRLNLSL